MVQWARSPDGADVEITVRPNHSQPRPALRRALAVCGALTGAIAGAFWHLGAWPVVPFAALAVLGLSGAAWWHARSATDHERLIFHDHQLRIERHRGLRDEHLELNAAWVAIHVPRNGPGLNISSHGRITHIGECLGTGETRLLRRLLRHLLPPANHGDER